MTPASTSRPRKDEGVIDPDAAEVKAAGGIVWRRGAGGVEVAVVHRPHRSDWSLPKGKLDPGETWEQAALREVEEEIGLRCSLGRELLPVSYTDSAGRAKVVRYWLMEPESGEFTPNDEVDELRWLIPSAAVELLTYPRDRELVASAL
jgi:8-oxo-dGTP diphosphatase